MIWLSRRRLSSGPKNLLYYDDFERANQAPLGTPPTGQTYLYRRGSDGAIGEPGGSQVLDGRFVSTTPADAVNNTVYAGILFDVVPQYVGGVFSFDVGLGGVGPAPVALVSCNSTTIDLSAMVHLIVTPTVARLTMWGVWGNDDPMEEGTTNYTLPTAIPIDGAPHDISMTIIGNQVTCRIDKYAFSAYDSRMAVASGRLIFWEPVTGNIYTTHPRWESTFAYEFAG